MRSGRNWQPVQKLYRFLSQRAKGDPEPESRAAPQVRGRFRLEESFSGRTNEGRYPPDAGGFNFACAPTTGRCIVLQIIDDVLELELSNGAKEERTESTVITIR